MYHLDRCLQLEERARRGLRQRKVMRGGQRRICPDEMMVMRLGLELLVVWRMRRNMFVLL